MGRAQNPVFSMVSQECTLFSDTLQVLVHTSSAAITQIACTTARKRLLCACVCAVRVARPSRARSPPSICIVRMNCLDWCNQWTASICARFPKTVRKISQQPKVMITDSCSMTPPRSVRSAHPASLRNVVIAQSARVATHKARTVLEQAASAGVLNGRAKSKSAALARCAAVA